MKPAASYMEALLFVFVCGCAGYVVGSLVSILLLGCILGLGAR